MSHRQVTAEFPPDPGAVSAARRFVSRSTGLEGDDVSRAHGIISELVGNAVVHGGTDLTVTIDQLRDRVRLEVRDEGPGKPQVRESGDSVIGGWGLLLVEDLADRWGVDYLRDAKVVWAEFKSNPG